MQNGNVFTPRSHFLIWLNPQRHTPKHAGQYCQQPGRNPDPNKFTSQHRRATRAEKSRKRYRGNQDGVPRKKETCVIERREERHPEAAIRHGIQKSVARRRNKEILPQPSAVYTRQRVRESHHQGKGREDAREEQRVREPAMPAKITVANSKPKPDHVNVGQRRAHHRNGPYPLWNFWPRENASNSKCRNRM